MKFKKLTEICSIKTNSKKIKESIFTNYANNEACKLYVSAYLEVANHNCKFDLYQDKLHKLDTKSIKFEQILKAIEIYAQKSSTKENGAAIDHLWMIFNRHWPCKK